MRFRNSYSGVGIESSSDWYKSATKQASAIPLRCPSSHSTSGDLWILSSRPLKWILRTRSHNGVSEKGVSSPTKSSSSGPSRSHMAVGCRSCSSPVIFSDCNRCMCADGGFLGSCQTGMASPCCASGVAWVCERGGSRTVPGRSQQAREEKAGPFSRSFHPYPFSDYRCFSASRKDECV